MFNSKYADPADTPSPPSRRKRSRADNMSGSIIASPSSATLVRAPSGAHPPADKDTPIVEAVPDTPVRNSDPALLGAQEASAVEEITRDESISPLPHVAEIARNQKLPEPTVILSHSPAPNEAAETVSLPDTRQPPAQVNAQSATSTLHVPAPLATPSPDIISRSNTPRAIGIRKLRSPRGRVCIIKIASDLDKKYHGSSSPMKPGEVEARIQAFEQAGFDTRGFGSGEMETIDSMSDQSQARAIFPDQQEMLDEHKQQKFEISVPIKKDWDDYVDFLREEKLRQLGVSMGDEPAPPPLSRQATSPYPPLAFSPPIPGSSAMSQHHWQNLGPFSAPFSPGLSTNNTSLGMASPQPFNHLARPGHLSRQSTFGFQFPGPQYAGQTATTIQQSWSPQRQYTPDGISRGVSPSIAKSAQPPSASPSSDTGDVARAVPSTPLVDVATNSNEGDRADGVEPQPIERKTSYSPSNEKATTGAQLSSQFANLASPKPQGHRSNISASLEREAESAQYYPGEYVNEDDEVGTPIEGKLDWNSLGASRKSAVAISGDDQQSLPRHVSNGSSSLNVAAKEFKFDPQSSHARNFSMSNDALMPSTSAKTAKAANATSSVSFATAHSNQGSVSLTNFNVAAPEFKPPTQKNFAFSPSWFNFSKKSEPPKDNMFPIPEKEEEKKKPTQSTSSKIFGGLADIIKPGKKSKAIPIVNPESIGLATTKDISEGEQEDEDGRIERSYESRKRGRRAGTDGDEVPRFAEPTPEPETLPSAATATRDESPKELGSDISKAELQRHVNEDLELPSARRPLQLEYDLDVNGDFSDSSNVPWHGVDADHNQAPHKEALESSSNRVMALSPTPSSQLHVKEQEVVRSSDGENRSLPYPTQEKDEAHESLYPSFKDAEDIADYINNDNSDFGVDDGKPAMQSAVTNTFLELPSPTSEPHSRLRNLLSPSPDQFQRRLGGGLADGQYKHQQDHRMMRNSASPVRRLNTMADAPVSDWDDMLSSGEELRIPQQHHMGDAHMAALVEGLLKRHLAPFEKTLKDLGKSLNSRETRGISRSSRPRSSFDKSDSDADEESEAEDRMPRHKNARSERRMSHIRSAVKEAMTAAQQDGFGQLEQETKYRKAAEQRADDLQRLLTITEKEIALYKESTANQDDRIRSLEDDKDEALQRNGEVEEELRTKTLDFTSEVAKLENDLDEYRSSSAKWSAEIDTVKHAREALIRTIESMKRDTADNTKERAVLSNKLTSTEEELKVLQGQLNTERRDRERAQDDQRRELDTLTVRLSEANELKQKLSTEINTLSQKEMEATKSAIKSGVMLEETQKAKSSLELQINKLNDKAVEHSTIVARYEREASEAHENTAIEVQRTRTVLETDIEIANKRVENTKADLETRLEMAKSELDNVRKDHDSVRGRYERSLNESIASRKEAVQEANSNHNKRLQEERERFDQALRELSAQHDRAMRNALEDKQRSVQLHSSSLELSDSRVAHLTDRVAHLEERLAVAQSAAQAAATAAQSAKSLASTNGSLASSRSISTPAYLDKVSPQALRESVVVLQEQLQEREARIEQLEADASVKARQPESEDPASRSRLQEKEAEVGWLREILNVRLDDLSDLVSNLQLEKFDRGAARNAAIRIKANLQMEQQERDRQLDSSKANVTSPSIPSLTDIQNFASPKAAQLAAAFGNWRRNPPTLAGMREAQGGSSTPSRPSSGPRPGLAYAKIQEISASTNAEAQGGLRNPMAAAAASNAAKRNDANSFMSGLMTPPTSNLRRSPSNSATPTQSVPNTARPRTPSRTMSRPGMTSNTGSPEKRTQGPSTPDLYRKGDYDLDAELAGQEIGEDDEMESPIKKDRTEDTADQTRLEPFGEVMAKADA